MERKIYLFYLLSFLYLFSNTACNNDSITNPNNYKEFLLEYNVSGGISGEDNTLTVNKNDSVYYTSHFHKISSIFNEKKLDDIYNILINNDFFELLSRRINMLHN